MNYSLSLMNHTLVMSCGDCRKEIAHIPGGTNAKQLDSLVWGHKPECDVA